MKAMLFGAGYGTRMKPLSDTYPKPALPFFNQPLIAHQLAWLAQHGVDTVVINLHHQGSVLRQTADACVPPGVTLHFLDEPVILGTGGGLRAAMDHFKDESEFLVINGDIYTDIDLREPLKAHRSRRPLSTLVLNTCPSNRELFGVGLNAENRILTFWDEPPNTSPTQWCAFTGIHVVSPDIFSLLPGAGFSCIKEAGYIPALVRGDTLIGVAMAGNWFDLGTPSRYLEAHMSLMDSASSLTGHPEVSPQVACASPLPQNLRIIPPVAIGAGLSVPVGTATVGPGAIVGSNVTLGDGAEVSRSIVLDGTNVSGNLRNAISAPGMTPIQVT